MCFVWWCDLFSLRYVDWSGKYSKCMLHSFSCVLYCRFDTWFLRYLSIPEFVSILDIRYFRRKCNFVYIFRGYLKRLRHKNVHKKNTIFPKKNYDIAGKTKSRFVLSKMRLFFEDPILFSKIWFFLIENSDFFPKTYEIRGGGVVLCYILLFENIRNPVFGHFPSFPASSFMPRVTYLQYLTQCGVKPGLYCVRCSTQTELRKRIYADTRIMAFILLRRSRRVCTRIVGVFSLGICAIPTA